MSSGLSKSNWRKKKHERSKGLFLNPSFPPRLNRKTDVVCGHGEGNSKNRLNWRRAEIMGCIGGTCSASPLSFHLTAEMKAYNQALLIGPDGLLYRNFSHSPPHQVQSRAVKTHAGSQLTHSWLISSIPAGALILPFPPSAPPTYR